MGCEIRPLPNIHELIPQKISIPQDRRITTSADLLSVLDRISFTNSVLDFNWRFQTTTATAYDRYGTPNPSGSSGLSSSARHSHRRHRLGPRPRGNRPHRRHRIQRRQDRLGPDQDAG
jgi:hypothetical protein